MAQILAAEGPDEQLTINGVALQQVSVVGQLREVDVQVTMMSMRVDDGSGMIECVHLLPPDEDAARSDTAQARRAMLQNGAWARIVGRITNTGGQRQIEAYMLRAITDHNEITFHRLDVIRTLLAQTRPRKQTSNFNGTPMRGTSTPMGAVPGDGMLNDLARAVFEYARQRYDQQAGSGTEGSFSVNDVIRDVPSCGNAYDKAKEVLESLASDGHVYTTLDENTYAFCKM